MLEREIEKISTRFGKITIKKGFFKGNQVKSKPEYEDCKRAAEKNKIPLPEVYKEVEKVLNARKKE